MVDLASSLLYPSVFQDFSQKYLEGFNMILVSCLLFLRIYSHLSIFRVSGVSFSALPSLRNVACTQFAICLKPHEEHKPTYYSVYLSHNRMDKQLFVNLYSNMENCSAYINDSKSNI